MEKQILAACFFWVIPALIAFGFSKLSIKMFGLTAVVLYVLLNISETIMYDVSINSISQYMRQLISVVQGVASKTIESRPLSSFSMSKGSFQQT